MAEQIDNNQERFIKDAVQQFVDAQIDGQEPDMDKFVNKYPEFEHQIRRRISSVRKIDALFAGLTQAEESDFEDSATGDDLVGQKIGGFEIAEMIGRGGMGVVYLARDTKLDRSVAIKSMPVELVGDSTSRMRFRREAKLLASLNHPNIAVIHEIVEQDEGSGYLVLEYIPGRTLAEQIAHKPLKLEEALSIGQQIAEALLGAYEQGVIHRDLKPSNIKITPEGRVKVLDFGLAKATETQDEKAQSTITQPGRIVGTPAYMSPEQARGNPTDHRTDIWSFGCVMYEMLAGRLPFEGGSGTETLARVLEREPDWQALPQATPVNVKLLIRRCLEKDPRQRLQHMGDVALEIRETLNLPAVVPPMTASAMTVTQPGTARRSIITRAATLAITAIIAGLITWSLFRPSPPPLPGAIKLSIPLAPTGKAALIHAGNIRLVLSPDGKLLVLSDPTDGEKQLYVRSMDNFEIKPIPGTENAYDPFFSPDGQWLAFFTKDALDKRSLWKLRMNQNGRKVLLAESQHAFGQGTWSDDNFIFFCGGGHDDDDNLRGIFQVSADGGTPERLSSVDSEFPYCFYPRVLPDGKTVMYNGGGTVNLLSRVTGKSTVLVRHAHGGQYSHTGHLLFNRERQLFAVPFDVNTLKITGQEVLAIRDVLTAAWSSIWYFSIARNGTLAYVPLPSEASSLVWVDRQGNIAPVAGSPDGRYSNPRLSPIDETELAVMIQEDGCRHIWRYDLNRHVPTQLTFGPFFAYSPDWVLPDANRISFSLWEVGTVYKPQLLSLSLDGTGKPEPLFPNTLDFGQVPSSWSPDGKYLSYNERYSTTTPTSRVWILPFGDNGKPGEPALFLDEKQHIREVRFRPSDGRCIAYSSDKTGRDEIYIKEFLWGNLSEGWVERISSEGGTEPCWSRDGSKLFYRGANGMMEVTVHANQNGTIDVGKSQVLFGDSIYSTNPFGCTNYDVTSDERFIMVKGAPPTQINVIFNWAEELRRLAPMVKD